ncbi:LysR family transcriptional regulator [Methylovirgula sp. 4M-Z18]|uniref:LysR family transcriptional regulator n=1 Tax=Methylovirgula sp. 4M-Z18 TaxID=2293567 RepID=UPI000E2F736C|nr:LysR family transcriptional regulator [Methylovirgula sp. 4M-Z18]RFB79226.1 LysR family transcriptional regulator [Methylovirgula sp. 4M-Z18]
MKFDGIASFVAVAEEGSISEAARALRLSKSVVSERLAELERSLGASLLHRTTRRVSVTEDGAAFLERAKRILQEVSEAKTDLAERRGTLSGPMRISAPVTFGRMHLGPALYPFLAANPEIEMSLDLDDRRVDIASGVYDGVVRHGTIDDSRLMVWRLAPSRRVLVASDDYLARHGVPATIAELNAHKGIFYTNRGVADWRFATPKGVEIVRARIGFRVNNGDMMRDATVAGLGIALLPLFIAGPDIRDGKVKVVDVGVRPASEFIYLAHPEGRRPPAKLRALADHLKAAFGDPPYWENGVD